MKRLFSGILPIIVIIAFGAASLAFNYTVVDVRLDDLGHLLGQAAKAEDENRSLGMLARYELIRRRMKRGHENTGDYELESRVQAVVSNDWDSEEESSVRLRLLKSPARILLNIVRTFLGKEIRTFEKESSDFDKQIEVGYFFERNRHYDKAVEVYRRLLKSPGLTDDYRRYLVLHEGFCLSLVSKYKEAKTSYEEVITRYPNSEAAVVAWKLIDFLENIEKELKSVTRGVGGLETARKLYLLMDYRGAIKEFSKLLKKRKRGKGMLEMRFLKGRAHEELGENQEALREYKEILNKAPKSKWGREANRRIYILGEFYEKDKEMTEMAMNRIEEYRDGSFFGKLKGYSSISDESDEDKKLRVVSRRRLAGKKTGGLSSQDIDAMLDGLDLTGEIQAEKDLKKMEAEEAKAKEREREFLEKDLVRRQSVMDHQFRKPLALKRIINKNLHELKYLYNRHLRKGRPFEGKIVVNFVIKANGTVKDVKIKSSTTRNPKFDRQVVKKILRWRFLPIPAKMGDFRMVYPFDFSKEE